MLIIERSLHLRWEADPSNGIVERELPFTYKVYISKSGMTK